MNKAIKKAVSLAGGPSKVARELNISPWAVSKWVKCPPARVLTVEKLCGGEVSRYELRNDIYGES